MSPFSSMRDDRLYRQKETRCKQDRDDAEEGDEKAIGRIISFAEKHVERSESCAEERHEESCNRRVIRLSEMQKFHGPQPEERFVFKILGNRLLVKGGKRNLLASEEASS